MDWDQIVEDLGPRLYKYFCARFSDEGADDLTQETLLRLVNKVQSGHFNEAKGSLPMFSFGIARFVALEAKESAIFSDDETSLEKLESSEDLEASYIFTDQVSQLRSAIQQLPDTEQEIILLTIDEEFTYEEISQLLSMPVGTIKSHVSRAKNKLIEIINR